MDITARIEELKPWYQTINLPDGQLIKGHGGCGDPAWPFLRDVLPCDVAGKRILDVGSNAGITSIRLAQLGASVLGLEALGEYMVQSAFVREQFEPELDIEYRQGLAEDISEEFGRFDGAIALSVLYHIGKLRRCGKEKLMEARAETIRSICVVVDDFVVTRFRKAEDLIWADEFFEDCDMELTKRDGRSRIFSVYRRRK